MRRIHAARRSSQWWRALLAGVLLAFALNSIAHASHRDLTGSTTTAHSIGCGYCATFGGVADLPAQVPMLRTDLRTEPALFHPDPVVRSARSACSAQPRAPPLH